MLPLWEHGKLNKWKSFHGRDYKSSGERTQPMNSPSIKAIEFADWSTPQAVKTDYGNASLLQDNLDANTIWKDKYGY